MPQPCFELSESSARRVPSCQSPCVSVLSDQLLRADGDPAACRRSQHRRALPKPGALRAQRLFQDQPVLGLGAASMLGGTMFQRHDDFSSNISHKKPGHSPSSMGRTIA
jgi:hypothetical protein